MSESRWSQVLSRLSPGAPLDLGDLLGAAGDAPPAPPSDRGRDGAAPPAALWDRTPDSSGCLGVRVSEPLADPLAVATRLAAIAMERGIQPVILSHVAESGFERLGFRVERIRAATPEEAERQEAELAAFWDIALILDAEVMTAFG